MGKLIKQLAICVIFTGIIWSSCLLADRIALNNNLIRFHVVANSDSAEDQAIKLSVRDAVLNSMKQELQNIADIEEARKYLQESIPQITQIANRTLAELGFEGEAIVSLCREKFDIRHYDTFTLPSGVYESLRIIIGEGAGKNWWCVSFPALCLPATSEEFESAAVSAGFSKPLTYALSDRGTFEVRFFLLDQIGRLENIFFPG